jgi:hypothetical protein
MLKHVLKKSKKTKKLTAAVAIVLIAGIGTLLLLNSHAASPFISKTADSGTLSNVTKQACSDTADGNCVVFEGAPETAPAMTSDSSPQAVAVDNSGDVYFDDFNHDVVDKLSSSGALSIVAGTYNTPGNSVAGRATSTDLYYPIGVAVDSKGNLYIGTAANIVKVTPTGTLSIYAGIVGQSGTSTPGPAKSSLLQAPVGLALDASSNLYIADQGTQGDMFEQGGTTPGVNDVIEKVTTAGTLSIIAGEISQNTSGAPTPGGQATNTPLDYPQAVAVDSSGNFYIGEGEDADKVNTSGVLSIVAGGSFGTGYPTPGPATSSHVNDIQGLALDSAGNLYMADSGNCVIEKVTPSGTLSIFAGIIGECGPATAGTALSSKLNQPNGITLDSSGNLYVADTANNTIDKITPSGVLSILTGPNN